MLKFLLLLNVIMNVIIGIMEKTQRPALRNIVKIQFYNRYFYTLEPKLSELYSYCVNAFCLCRKCVRR